MCTYGGEKTNETDVLRNPTFVVDISWKEGCKVPEILASEVVDLVNKGIMKANNEESRAKIFESTIVVQNIPKGSTAEDIKSLLQNF